MPFEKSVPHLGRRPELQRHLAQALELRWPEEAVGLARLEAGKVHRLEPGRMEKIRRNELSCIAEGCHNVVHEAGELDGLEEWKPPTDGAPAAGGVE